MIYEVVYNSLLGTRVSCFPSIQKALGFAKTQPGSRLNATASIEDKQWYDKEVALLSKEPPCPPKAPLKPV